MMDTLLLQTKLHIPHVRSKLIPRPQLLKRLNDARPGKLTLISAPAGFGKTTLLSQWIASEGLSPRTAWLSLDENDNAPARFLAYLIAALQTVENGIAPGLQDELHTPQSPPVEAIITILINNIAALSGNIVLVLDDYHLVTAPPIHKGVTFLVNHLPDNMHVVIATRADPPLPIARLRSQGQLTELRQVELRFSPAEANEFLKRVSSLGLSRGDIAGLISRTEGWIAGLQLASIALQTRRQPGLDGDRARDDTGEFIQAFTNSNRYILDYLIEEVLEQQPKTIQAFLLRTAILDRLNDSLADAVVGQLGDWQTDIGRHSQRLTFAPVSEKDESVVPPQSRAILNDLEAANLFIVPLDNERRWYRYHQLFADLLRKRLHQTQPELAPILHSRASQWYEHHGFIATAIDHALAAEEFERAATLIEQIAEATVMRSEVSTLLNWLEMLQERVVRARPTLSLFQAWAMLLAGRPLEQVEACLQEIDEESELLPSQMLLLRAFITILQGRLPGAAELTRQALAQLPPDDWFLRSVAAWILSISQASDDDVAVRLLDEVARLGQETGNLMVAVEALVYLARLRMRQGQLHQARELCERALALATGEQEQLLPVAGEALMGLGELSREWNNFAEASQQLRAGIDLGRRVGKATALPGYLSLVRLKQAQGDVAGAEELLQKAQHLAIQFDTATWWNEPIVALSQARLWIDQDNLEAAWGWAKKRGLVQPDPRPEGGENETKARVVSRNLAELEDTEKPINRLYKYEYLVLGRLLVAQGRLDEALELLARLRPTVERLDRTPLVIETQLVEALAHQARGNTDRALAALEQALLLAEPEGYIRLFVDEGPRLAGLLSVARERGIAPAYARRLLAAFAGTDVPQTLIEPLSERELQVLQLIGRGLKYKEIAGQLFISLNTVRYHTKNIYGKLNANNRRQAIARAKELNLL